PTTIYTRGTKFPNYSLSATGDYIATQNLTIGVRGGRYLSDTHDFNTNDLVKFNFATGTTNIGMAGVPASEQHPSGYTNVLNNSGTDHDTRTRNFFQADVTYFLRTGSSTHQIKGGFQLDRRANDVLSGELENLITLYWGTNLNGK